MYGCVYRDGIQKVMINPRYHCDWEKNHSGRLIFIEYQFIVLTIFKDVNISDKVLNKLLAKLQRSCLVFSAGRVVV